MMRATNNAEKARQGRFACDVGMAMNTEKIPVEFVKPVSSAQLSTVGCCPLLHLLV
jgi:hypothetical protein